MFYPAILVITTHVTSPKQEPRMAMITVLIADKHTLFRRSLHQLCEINGGFRVVACGHP